MILASSQLTQKRFALLDLADKSVLRVATCQHARCSEADLELNEISALDFNLKMFRCNTTVLALTLPGCKNKKMPLSVGWKLFTP